MQFFITFFDLITTLFWKEILNNLTLNLERIKVCGEQEFRCDSGLCIPVSWQCDGEMDCPGGLDEWDQICSESNASISRTVC